MDEHFDTLALKLESEFCPPLDPALVRAILSDYDHHDAAQIAAVRQQLDEFKAFAAVEEATGFDPSGSSGRTKDHSSAPGPHSSDPPDNHTESDSSPSEGTDLTSLSNGLSAASLEDGSVSENSANGKSNEHVEDVEKLDTSTKEQYLMDIFPTESRTSISYVLARCDGNFSRATDVLLNHMYFQDTENVDGEERIVTKGVEAFFEGNHIPRGRKAKNRKRRNRSTDSSARSSSVPVPSPGDPVNKWQTASKDVEYISSRTNIPVQTISSLYHKSGGTIPTTITALLELHIKDQKTEPLLDMATQLNVIALSEDFPSLSLPHAAALIQLTHPSTANAHELAKALTTPPRTNQRGGGMQLIPHYAPLDLPSASTSSAPMSRSSSTASTSSSYLSPHIPYTPHPPTTTTLAAARATAFAQAAAAHRKAKSVPHMSGAAAYYAQLGCEYATTLRAATAAEADALVAAQSSRAQLDLHGVNVRDAVRIARERVAAWWEGLGEGRIREWAGARGGAGGGEGFRVVTGVGNHSEDGVGKLGPAVVRALVGDGWKVEVGRGVVVVRGRGRGGR